MTEDEYWPLPILLKPGDQLVLEDGRRVTIEAVFVANEERGVRLRGVGRHVWERYWKAGQVELYLRQGRWQLVKKKR